MDASGCPRGYAPVGVEAVLNVLELFGEREIHLSAPRRRVAWHSKPGQAGQYPVER